MTQRPPVRRLSTLTSGDVADGPSPMLLVPLGATEQHGPHLPLATDTIVAAHWADQVAKALGRTGANVVVAPPLPYGSSGEHQMFPGTLSIGRDALSLVLVELVRSAASSFGRVVLLSGHAGNLEPVIEATDKLVSEGHDVVHIFPSWPADAGVVLDAHAGRTETSIMLHLQPDDVRLDLIEPGDTRPLGELLPTLMSEGVEAVSPNGVLGDPSDADADEGKILMQLLIERTLEILEKTGPRPAD